MRRLIESFLVSVLGSSGDQVHDEAENLEHAASDFMVDRIDEFLEHPTRDPPGDPIPSADGVDARVSISAGEPYSDALSVSVESQGGSIALGRTASAALYVSGGTVIDASAL